MTGVRVPLRPQAVAMRPPGAQPHSKEEMPPPWCEIRPTSSVGLGGLLCQCALTTEYLLGGGGSAEHRDLVCSFCCFSFLFIIIIIYLFVFLSDDANTAVMLFVLSFLVQ